MSLERSVEQISEACQVMARKCNVGNLAVVEIIRERDQARKELEAMKRIRDSLLEAYERRRAENFRLGRIISALRGTITRMKNSHLATQK